MTEVGTEKISESLVRGSRTLFPYLVVAFIFILLSEALWGVVSLQVPFGYLLILLVGAAVLLMSATHIIEARRPEALTRNAAILAAVAGVIVATIVWYKTRELGLWSFFMSGTSGMLIVMLAVLASTEEES